MFNRRTFLAALSAASCSLLGLGLLGCTARPAVAQGEPAAARAAKHPAQHVFIVSFDGGKPAVMQVSKMPVFFQTLKDGAGTLGAQTVLPSITLVSHTSMLTGVGPAKHHVDWNEWIPEKGLVQVPTIFAIAKKTDRKLITAMFVGKQKFAHLFQPGTLDAFSMPDYSAKIVAVQAAEYIKAEKPDLCFIHFADSDGAGHSFGWGSDQQKQAFADEDAALAVVEKAIKDAGIASSSLLILTADHGGHAKTHGSNSPEDMTIPWVAWGAGVKKGYSITAPVTTYDTAATALWALGIPVPADFDGKPVTTAFQDSFQTAAKP